MISSVSAVDANETSSLTVLDDVSDSISTSSDIDSQLSVSSNASDNDTLSSDVNSDSEVLSTNNSLNTSLEGYSSYGSYSSYSSSNSFNGSLNSSDSSDSYNGSTLSSTNKTATKITTNGSSIIRGNKYIANLTDSDGNGLVNQIIVFTVCGKNYTKNTNSTGMAYLTINLYSNNYTLYLYYAGDSNYNSSSKSVNLVVLNNVTELTIANSTVIRSNYFNVYLKDGSGNSIKGENLIFGVCGKNYSKITNSGGIASLKINLYSNNYSIFCYYAGYGGYAKSNVSTTLIVLNNLTKLSVANSSVIRGNCLIVYLKDASGNIISGEKIVLAVCGKNYTKTTNSEGIAKLQINLYANTYPMNISYTSSGAYVSSNKSITLNVLDNSSSTNIGAGSVSTANSSQYKTGLNEKNIVSNISAYLVGSGYSAITTAIKNKAASLTKGLNTTADKAYAIFNFVRDKISYSYYANSKKGAGGTLSAGSGNCVDQASLIVALCRAAGIPARYSHAKGCTFSSGLVTGHVWAQILIGGVWYSADATSSRNSLGNIKNWNTNSFSNLKQYAAVPF